MKTVYISTHKIRNKLRALSEEVSSFDSAWLVLYKIENWLTDIEEDKEDNNSHWKPSEEQMETEMKSPFTGGKVAILSRQEEVTFRGEKVKILRKYYRCEDTGREFTDSKLDDDMMWAVFRTYCEKKGMTSFTDIMLKQEQPMPDSTKLIELWHEDKEMLKEKDFRDDPWRLAYNAFMCGFCRGLAVKQEQPDVVFEKACIYEIQKR